MSIALAKYIYKTSCGCKVDIRKAGKRLTSNFSFRSFGSQERTLTAAIEWRNEMHKMEFGYPVSPRPIHGATRSVHSYVAIDNFQFKVFPGMYCEKVNGKPCFFTVNVRNRKCRFSIKKLGLFNAYEEAVNRNLNTKTL